MLPLLPAIYIFIVLVSAYTAYSLFFTKVPEGKTFVVSHEGVKKSLGPGTHFTPFHEKREEYSAQPRLIDFTVPEARAKQGLLLKLKGYAYYKVHQPLRAPKNPGLVLRKELLNAFRHACKSLSEEKIFAAPDLVSDKVFFTLNQVKGVTVYVVQIDEIILSPQVLVQGSEQYSTMLELAGGSKGFGTEKVEGYVNKLGVPGTKFRVEKII